MSLHDDNGVISIYDSSGNLKHPPELYEKGLKVLFVNFGAQYRYVEQAKRIIAPCFTHFLGENKTLVKEIYKFHHLENERNENKIIEITPRDLTTQFFFFLYDCGVERIWIFHPHLTNPMRLPATNQKFCVINVNTGYKIQSYFLVN